MYYVHVLCACTESEYKYRCSTNLHPHELQSYEATGLLHKQRISGSLSTHSQLISLCRLLHGMVEGLASIKLAGMEATENLEDGHLEE
jgi:hypothetical protein